jgi:hypothetical protein
MRKIKTLVFIKLLLLIGAMILAWFLIFINKSPAPVEQSTIIILDVSSGMMTQDIPTSKWDLITRLDAAKKIVQKIIAEFPQRAFWLMTYWPQIDYLIPSTFDSGTLLQYANSLLAESNVESWTRKAGVENWGLAQRNEWLLESLENKNIIVLWDVPLPKMLLTKAQKISLATYKNFNPQSSIFNLPSSEVSTVQTQWLIIILCLLVILSI